MTTLIIRCSVIAGVFAVLGLIWWLIKRRQDYITGKTFIHYNLINNREKGLFRAYCLEKDLHKLGSRWIGRLYVVQDTIIFHDSHAIDAHHDSSGYSEVDFLKYFGLKDGQVISEFLEGGNGFERNIGLRVPFISEAGMSFVRQKRFYRPYLSEPRGLYAIRSEWVIEHQDWLAAKKGFFAREYAESRWHNGGRLAKRITAWLVAIPVSLIAFLCAGYWMDHSDPIHQPNAEFVLTTIVDTPHGKVPVTQVTKDIHEWGWLEDDTTFESVLVRCIVHGEPVNVGGMLVRVRVDCQNYGKLTATAAAALNLHDRSPVILRWLRAKYAHLPEIITQEDAEILISGGKYQFAK